MDINTCFATTESYHTIAYYSHLIPVFLTGVLIFFVLVKSRFSFLSKVFSVFGVAFCLWLIGDLIIWTSSNYNLVNVFWAPLDYINILFYVLGAYFFVAILRGGDVPVWQKLLFFALSLPAWWETVTSKTIEAFYKPQCEALNSAFLTQYKLGVEIFIILFITVFAILKLRRSDRSEKKKILFVAGGINLFFIVFGATEYISSVTGIYEINLYSLFVLPVFLFLITYSITNLQLFHLRLISTQVLTYIMMIIVGSQFFFLENTTDQIITAVTFVLALSFGIILAKDAKEEIKQREQIEQLAASLKETNADLARANIRLKELDRQKTEFVSFATHQLRSPLTAMKGYSSLILEGDYGEISLDLRDAVGKIHESTNTLITVVNDYLNISRIELGTMKYDLAETDLNDLVGKVIAELKPNIDKSGLEFIFAPDTNTDLVAKVDIDKFKQVLANLIDNSMKYTPKGSVRVSLTRKENKILFAVKDTGIGMAAGVIPKLFAKFSRAENASKVNIRGTGLGLFVAKEIVIAHNGRIWAESEGEGKGSQFYVELPVT